MPKPFWVVVAQTINPQPPCPWSLHFWDCISFPIQICSTQALSSCCHYNQNKMKVEKHLIWCILRGSYRCLLYNTLYQSHYHKENPCHSVASKPSFLPKFALFIRREATCLRIPHKPSMHIFNLVNIHFWNWVYYVVELMIDRFLSRERELVTSVRTKQLRLMW